MTWGEIYKQFKSEYPKTEVSDYRPFVEEWLPRDRAGIIVWLKNGDVIAYFSKKTEAEGSERGIMVANAKPDKELNEAIKHICDVVQKRIDEAYQRGVEDGRNETWEAARKVALNSNDGGLCIEDLDEIFDCYTLQQVFKRHTAQQTIAKLKAYEEQKADDEIKVGDEVKWKGDRFIVTRICQPLIDKLCDGLGEDGHPYLSIAINRLTKTGRHFDIDKILEEMQT